ncbi:hypothetical protein BP5796_03412 [Coleophoma crateriformis]|uniref:Uncharacterized protein n=1 Tax=Coleophoma crateriformis TaxID=565419 RepID=A0A3D8SPJ5_9HELO|nr:hypothetical protein BP5796_03412 [Coleophoma crateriformis]
MRRNRSNCVLQAQNTAIEQSPRRPRRPDKTSTIPQVMASTMQVHVGALQDKTFKRGNLKLLTPEQQRQQTPKDCCSFISSPIAAVARLHPSEVASDRKPPKHISELFTTPHRRKLLELNGLIPNENEELAYFRINSISPLQVQELRARKEVSSLRVAGGLPPGDVTPLEALFLNDWEEPMTMDSFDTEDAFPTLQDEATIAENCERDDECTPNSSTQAEEPVGCAMDADIVNAISADNTTSVEVPNNADSPTGNTSTTPVHNTNSEGAGASVRPIDHSPRPRMISEYEPSASEKEQMPEKKPIVVSLESPINKDKALPPIPQGNVIPKLSPMEKDLPAKPVRRPQHSPPKRLSILDATDFEAKSPTFRSKFQILTPANSTGGSDKNSAKAESLRSSSSNSSLKSDYSGKTHIAQAVTMQRAVPRLVTIAKPRATRTSLMRQTINRSPSVQERNPRDHALKAGPAKQRPASTNQLTNKNGSPAQRFNKPHSTAMTIANFSNKADLLSKKVRFTNQTSSSSSIVVDDDELPSRGLTDFPSGTTIHEFVADDNGSNHNDWSSRYSNGYGMGMKKSSDAEKYIMGSKSSGPTNQPIPVLGHDISQRDFAITPTNSTGNYNTTARRQAKVQVQLNTRQVDSRDNTNKRGSFIIGSTSTYVGAGLRKPSRIPRRSGGLETVRQEMTLARTVARQHTGMPGISTPSDMSSHPPRTSSLPNSPANIVPSSSAATPQPLAAHPPVYMPKQTVADRLSRPTNASAARQTSSRFSLHQRGKRFAYAKQSPVKKVGVSKIKKATSSQTVPKAVTLSSMGKLRNGWTSRARSLIGRRRHNSERPQLNINSDESISGIPPSSAPTSAALTSSQNSGTGHENRYILDSPAKQMAGTNSDPVRPHDTEPEDKMANENSERDRHEEVAATRAHVRTNAGRAGTARQTRVSPAGNGGDEPPTPPPIHDGPRGHYSEAGEETNNDELIESVEHDEDEHVATIDRSSATHQDATNNDERENLVNVQADHAEDPSVAEMYDTMFRLSEDALNRVIAIAQRMEVGRPRERATEAIEELGQLIMEARDLRTLTIQWNRIAAETIANAANVASNTAERFEALAREMRL